MDNNANFYIERLLDYYEVTTIKQLAEKINTQTTSISSWRSRNAVSAIKKKCRELGIHNEIFNNAITTFNQHGNGQQIQNQTNASNDIGNNNNSSTTIDNDILELIKLLNSFATKREKVEELKQDLTNLIGKYAAI